MRNILSIVLVLVLVMGSNAQAQEFEFSLDESCTVIVAGKKATTDGSVITSHTCDGNYRTWLNIVPATTNNDGNMMKIKHGTMHTETPWDSRGVSEKGEIPQVEKTFAYLNTAYPCMNEKQLAIGESTIGGRKELQNNKGLFMIENLEAIVLQRCTTARQAIKMIGELVKKYGYADAGECLCIADKKEVWILEIFGEGKDNIGAVWAAQRVPDNHVGVCANFSRISNIDLSKSDYFMASENVFDLAKRMNLWDGNEPFKFWKAYSGEKPFQIREFFVLSSVAPSLKLDINAEELPFTVQPDKKISARDVMALLRSTFENTAWDMTKNIKVVKKSKNDAGVVVSDTVTSSYANPWMNSDMIATMNYQNDTTVKFQRTCSVAWCSYSFVAQLRDWLPDEFGGVAWFAFDNPAQSPRIPIFCGTLSLPKEFNYSGQYEFNENSAHWSYRQANRLATVRYGSNRDVIESALIEFENKGFDEMTDVEKNAAKLLKEDEKNRKNNINSNLCNDYLTRYTNDFYAATALRWIKIRNSLWTKMKFSF